MTKAKKPRRNRPRVTPRTPPGPVATALFRVFLVQLHVLGAVWGVRSLLKR